MLPTPRSSDSTGHPGDTLTDAMWKTHRPDLAEAGMLAESRPKGSTLLPTPTARDYKDGAESTWHPEKAKLPHSIGALTAEPSTDTPPSSDAPPLTLWTDADD